MGNEFTFCVVNSELNDEQEVVESNDWDVKIDPIALIGRKIIGIKQDSDGIYSFTVT